MTIGERIYYCRIENKMTQKQLAEKAGMADSAIRKYESGRVTPKFDTLNRIAAALDVPWTTLYPDGETLPGTEKPAPEQAAEPLETPQSRMLSEQLLQDLAALNAKGQEEAAKRVHELTFLPEYQKDPAEK